LPLCGGLVRQRKKAGGSGFADVRVPSVGRRAFEKKVCIGR